MPASRTKPRRGPTPPRKQAAQADGTPRLQRAAQLGYVATVAAGSDGCDCRACKAIREQNKILLEEYDRGEAGDGVGPDPQP